MRKEFELPEDDVCFLESLGLPWETLKEGRVKWVIIHEWKLPDGYTQSEVSVAVNIPEGYPDTPLDMAYFYPAIIREDGKAIRALSERNIDGKTWQRWSRHRTNNNKWVPGEDDLLTHFALIENWLNEEFNKR